MNRDFTATKLSFMAQLHEAAKTDPDMVVAAAFPRKFRESGMHKQHQLARKQERRQRRAGQRAARR